MKCNKAVSAILSMVIILTGITACANNNYNSDEEDEMERLQREEHHLRRSYARGFGFEGGPFSLPAELTPTWTFDKIVFVHSPEESAGFPDDVFVTWPGEKTERALKSFNNMIIHSKDRERELAGEDLRASVFFNLHSRFDINDLIAMLEGLDLPITMEDLIDDWETIAEVFSMMRRDSFLGSACN